MAVKCKETIFSPINSLSFRISGGTTSIVPHYIEDTIVSLEMPEDYTIALGDKLKIKKKPYKVNIIEKHQQGKTLYYDLKIAERTKTSLFILPMLGGTKKLFMYNSLFMNAFIGDHEFENHIVLLYRWSQDPLFMKFEQALTTFKTFVKRYDPDPYHVVFVFTIPSRHKANYKRFLKSKYSLLNDIYKLKILEFHGMEIDGALGQILFRSEERKLQLEEKLDAALPEDSELLSLIDPKIENLDVNHYLEKNDKK